MDEIEMSSAEVGGQTAWLRTAVADDHDQAVNRVHLLRELGLRQQDNTQLDAFAKDMALTMSRLVGDGCPQLTGVVNFIGQQQHFVGLHEPNPTTEAARLRGEFPRQMDLDSGFCPNLLKRGGLALQLDDVCDWPRFSAGNPALDVFHVRTYLGAALTYRNVAYGTVCVIAHEPTKWPTNQGDRKNVAINAIKEQAATLAQLLGVPQS